MTLETDKQAFDLLKELSRQYVLVVGIILVDEKFNAEGLIDNWFVKAGQIDEGVFNAAMIDELPFKADKAGYYQFEALLTKDSGQMGDYGQWEIEPHAIVKHIDANWLCVKEDIDKVLYEADFDWMRWQ